MNFNDIYHKHHKMIHYLLKHYNVKYNYDEFYQLLLIKLWQLSKNYNDNSNVSLSSFL
ncbi:sigma factor, partial [Staphylococcus aureus]|nr:sigma factor [Staphylococcus aureus]